MRQSVRRCAGPFCFAVALALAPVVPTALARPGHAQSWNRSEMQGPADVPLGWVTYLGGSNQDEGHGIALDGQGNVYVTGVTLSSDFLISPGAAQGRFAGGEDDAFVASYNEYGRPRWATYLGGTGNDYGTGIATDGQGNVYVTGDGSGDFPTTAGAAQPAGGSSFVVSYDGRGRLRWATRLGGSYGEESRGIATDGQGNVYVTGTTSSFDFPTSSGAAQPYYGGQEDAFMASYDSNGQLRWATYLGGSGIDDGFAIAADRQGNVYVTGHTTSGDFPAPSGQAQTGSGTAFVGAYDARGRLRWTTRLGGNGDTAGRGIATDEQGNVYLTGYTLSNNFPITPGAAQPTYGGEQDAFVASYDSNGKSRWATYLGGSFGDQGNGIATDGRGTVYITGDTQSADFPVTPGAAQTHRGGDTTFAVAYDVSGRLRWATYLGGSSKGEGDGIAADGQGNVSITGYTSSLDFPITPGAAQSRFAGDEKAFIARLVTAAARPTALDPASPPPPGTPNARYFPATRHTLAGPFLAYWDRLGGVLTLGLPLSEPFTLAGQRVQVTERAVLLLSGGRFGLLPLGRLLSAARVFAPVAPIANSAGRLYFPSTGHTISGHFLAYWQAHQGSGLLGPPIAEPDLEGLGDGTGKVYMVQWFANGRLEFHPEIKDARYQVLQGRVGYEYLHRAGLL